MTFKLCLLIVFTCYNSARPETCQTPDHKEGECKVLGECQPLHKLLKDRPLSNANTLYLKQSNCGYLGSQPKVCCPIGSSTLPQSTTENISDHLIPGYGVCGVSNGDKIYKGNFTFLDDYPWMALIEYQKAGKSSGFHCGGALISKRYVLTAAHCIKKVPKTWKISSVRLGEHNTTTNPDCENFYNEPFDCASHVNVPVEQQIIHESYNENDEKQLHDIALLRLNQNVQFTNFILPICLPRFEEEHKQLDTQKRLVVAGWGSTQTGSLYDTKRQGMMDVKPAAECFLRFEAHKQICGVGRNVNDLCKADSGGVLTTAAFYNQEVYWYATAVATSIVPHTCKSENASGVYTSVTQYVDWIVNNVKA